MRLLKLGMLICFDIFLNNGDRLPSEIWFAKGNVENCLIRYEVKEDTITSVMKDPENLDLPILVKNYFYIRIFMV